MEDYEVASSELTDDKTMVSRTIFVENVISNFRNEGFDFSHISRRNLVIVCNKMDMTYDFYLKHKMHAGEKKLNHIFNKDRNLINKLPPNWIHPLNRKFEGYRV